MRLPSELAPGELDTGINICVLMNVRETYISNQKRPEELYYSPRSIESSKVQCRYL